jgi:hypothetical protein
MIQKHDYEDLNYWWSWQYSNAVVSEGTIRVLRWLAQVIQYLKKVEMVLVLVCSLNQRQRVRFKMMLDCVCFLPIQHFHLKRMYAGNGELLQSDTKELLYKHFKKLASEAI